MRRRAINPLDYARQRWMQIILALSFVFLYFPILALIAFSFNDSKRNIVWRGFTFKYYEKAWNNESLHEAFTNTMISAGVSTLVSTVFGAMLALALYRYRFPGKGPFEGIAHLPIVIPEICMGVAAMAFFSLINVRLGLFTVTVSHIAFTIPFVAVVVRARMAGFDTALEEASYQIGTAYQLADDLLDLIGDETFARKTLRSDKKRGKFTLPQASEAEKYNVCDIIANLCDSAITGLNEWPHKQCALERFVNEDLQGIFNQVGL